LLHRASKVQLATLRTLGEVSDAGKERLITWALDVLNDEARKDDYVAAIRTLAVLGEPAKDALEKLEQLMSDGQQTMPVRVAAATALERMTGGDGLYQRRLWDGYQEDYRDIENSAQAKETLTKLERALNREQGELP
jgi:hypothetical protein